MKKIYLVYYWPGYDEGKVLLKAFSRKNAAELFIKIDASKMGRPMSSYRLQSIKVDETKENIGKHDSILD